MSCQRVFLKTSTKGKPDFIDLETEPFDKETSKMYLMCIMAEVEGMKPQKPNPDLSDPPTIQILKKRIEVVGLPISFNQTGWLATLAFTRDNPGRAVTLLIDCLNFFPEGTEVTARGLGELYPWGPYTEKAFEKYVDNYLKPKLVPHSELY